MKKLSIYVVSLGLLFISWECESYNDDPRFPASDFISKGENLGEYWPTELWRSCEPEEAGMKSKKLKELNEEIRLLLEMNIEFQSIVIVKDGYIVAEQYYSDDYDQSDLHRRCTKESYFD